MKTLPKELQTKLDELKSWMIFDGDQVKVARIARETEPRVSAMLNKKMTPSKKFMDAAIQVMEENQRTCGVQPTMKVA